jgi:H+/gluconate symporter-like permease
MRVLAVLILLHGAAVTVPTSTRARVLGQHGWRAQSKMFFRAPPPPPPPSLGASLQRQLGEVAPFLVSAVTITGALLGAYNFIDNRIEASSKEAAAANKETAMQLAALNSNLTISAIAILCVALLFVAVSKSRAAIGRPTSRSHRPARR